VSTGHDLVKTLRKAFRKWQEEVWLFIFVVSLHSQDHDGAVCAMLAHAWRMTEHGAGGPPHSKMQGEETNLTCTGQGQHRAQVQPQPQQHSLHATTGVMGDGHGSDGGKPFSPFGSDSDRAGESCSGGGHVASGGGGSTGVPANYGGGSLPRPANERVPNGLPAPRPASQSGGGGGHTLPPQVTNAPQGRRLLDHYDFFRTPDNKKVRLGNIILDIFDLVTSERCEEELFRLYIYPYTYVSIYV